MPADSSWLVLLLLLCLSGLVWAWRHRQALLADCDPLSTGVQRLLKPRTPADCPACCQQSTIPTPGYAVRAPVRPWREVKSRRGAPKRISTDGFACPNRRCTYYRIPDALVHALVGDGTHGKAERIQTFRCQACGVTFSSRRNTPLYRLKTPSHRVAEVLTALAEGLDVGAAERVFGYRHATITTWLIHAGLHTATLHDHFFQRLYLPHVQFDELRTRLRSHTRVLWLWLVVDPISKIIPVLHLGSRTQASAYTVVHDLRHRLAANCLPVFTSDGLNLYFYALTAHFGQWIPATGRRRRHWQVDAQLIYGQIKKTYRYRRLLRVTQIMRCGTRVEFTAAVRALGFSGRVNTAFIERLNLTARRSVAALARRTWATAQATPHLLAQLEWWRAYYHFVRPHASLRVALAQPRERGGRQQPQRYQQRTPAMAARLTNRRWTVGELLALPRLAEPMSTGRG